MEETLLSKGNHARSVFYAEMVQDGLVEVALTRLHHEVAARVSSWGPVCALGFSSARDGALKGRSRASEKLVGDSKLKSARGSQTRGTPRHEAGRVEGLEELADVGVLPHVPQSLDLAVDPFDGPQTPVRAILPHNVFFF